MNKDELKYYGVNAVLGIFRVRPQDIVKVYLLESRKRELSELLKWCAKEKKGYNFVEKDDLERLSASTHHEGVCVLAKRKEIHRFEEYAKTGLSGVILVLDGIGNPHNFGSMLRAASHFGVSLVLGDSTLPALSPSACRVAEGGAETVPVAAARDLPNALKNLRQNGFSIVSTSSHAERNIFEHSFAKNSAVIIGAETAGVSPDLAVLADVNVAVPGSGAVESLNVSAASAVVLAEYFRQQWKN